MNFHLSKRVKKHNGSNPLRFTGRRKRMLFARAIWDVNGSKSLQQIAEEDISRNYSWWQGELNCALPPREGQFGQRLPGLCAVCGANSYRELLQKLSEDRRNQNGWIRGKIMPIAIFEGEPVGHDPDQWPLFIARRVL